MADVTYKSEPTVSVHGVPQSQYDSSMAQGGQSGGGIMNHFRQHGMLYLIGIGAATLLVMFLVWRRNQQNTGLGTGNANTTGTATTSSPDQLWGAQLDADYQQLISTLNTNTGLLQQILNGAGSGTSKLANWETWKSGDKALISKGGFNPKSAHLGQQFSFEGIIGQLIPGSGGRVWWVPEIGHGALTAKQLQNIPVGTMQKELLYQS